MHLLIRKVMELTVVLIKAFHRYKLCTKVYTTFLSQVYHHMYTKLVRHL